MRIRLEIGARARLLWARVRDSLWFTPAVATLLAALLAAWAVRVQDAAWIPDAMRRQLFFVGGADGARGVLAAIAGSLITVTATVFSVTIVALQLAGSQYTPRVLRSFLADRVNQAVLGIFIGTFTYAVLVLRTVHGEAEDRPSFVPAFAVSLAVALVLVSIGALIYFINHAARSIQVSVILARETSRTLARIDDVFPRAAGDAAPAGDDAAEESAPPVVVLHAHRSGYLQAVHDAALVRVAEAGGCTMRVTRRIGDFVFPGEPLLEAWPAVVLPPGAEATLREALVLGAERTPEQDPEFGIIELSDIAVRAMSPGINDPTTAMQCVDRLGELLVHLGRRQLPPPPVCGPGGIPRLVLRVTTFDRAAGLAFDQLRYVAADNPGIVGKLLDTIARVRALVPATHHAALDSHTEAIVRAAARDR